MTWTLFLVWTVLSGPSPAVDKYLRVGGFVSEGACVTEGLHIREWFGALLPDETALQSQWRSVAWNVAFICKQEVQA